MRFVHPAYLYFLFVLAVPVLVHLFKMRRYKQEYFSNVRLLQQIQQEQKKSSKLREYRVLAFRMLTLACLVMAFAQPYLPQDEEDAAMGASPKLSIYLDNSLSMQAPSASRVLLDQAKEQVKKILQAFPPDIPVQLLTNDFEGSEQQFSQASSLLERLPEIDFSPVSRSFHQISARQRELFESTGTPPDSRLCYYVSDFQKSVWDLPQSPWQDSLESRVFVPVRGVDYANLSLDSLALENPVLQAGRDIGLQVFLRNRSDREQTSVPVRLFVDGKQTGVYPVDLEAGESRMLRIPFRLDEAGAHQAWVEVADYPMEFDNRLYFSLMLQEKIPVLHLYASGNASLAVAKVFRNDSLFSYRAVPVSRLDYHTIKDARFIVLENLAFLPSALVAGLEGFVAAGGSLLLVPPAAWEEGKMEERNPGSALDEKTSVSWQDMVRNLLSAGYGPFRPDSLQVGWMNREHPLFALALEKGGKVQPNESYPRIHAFYPLPSPSRIPYVPLMGFYADPSRGGQDFMRAYPLGKGMLYLIASPLEKEYGDFAAHYTFVVSLLDMALYQGGGARLYAWTGSREPFYLSSSLLESKDVLYHIRSEEGDFDIMPEIRFLGAEAAVLTHGEVTEAGNYSLVAVLQGVADQGTGKEAETSLVGKGMIPLSFNINRLESEKECWTDEELTAWISRFGGKHSYLLDPGKTDFSKQISRMNRGLELWKVFLIFALAFALLEITALRRPIKA